MKELLLIALANGLVNNVVLARFLGLCSFMGVSNKVESAIGMAIAAAGCGIGQGLGLKGACEGVARNPEASNKLTTMLLLGLAFIESLAIYALVINLILLLMNPFV